jgi:gluconolactonase
VSASIDDVMPHTDRFTDIVPDPGAVELLATGATFTEGPVYLPQERCVLFSDIPNDRILRWSEADGMTVWREPSGYANGATRDLEGRIVHCEHGTRRVSRTEHDGSVVTLVDRYGAGRLNSPNDAVVTPDGAIWFTDPPYGIVSDVEGHKADSEQDGNFVFRLDPASGSLEVVNDTMEEPNGLAFSPDRSLLYIADSSSVDGRGVNHHIMVFDVVDGRRLANGRVFAVIDPGVPDGLRVDEHGNVFTSAEDGVHVLAPDGTELGRILVPELVANVAFGGEDGRTLYMTATSSLYRIRLAVREAPGAGSSPR